MNDNQTAGKPYSVFALRISERPPAIIGIPKHNADSIEKRSAVLGSPGNLPVGAATASVTGVSVAVGVEIGATVSGIWADAVVRCCEHTGDLISSPMTAIDFVAIVIWDSSSGTYPGGICPLFAPTF